MSSSTHEEFYSCIRHACVQHAINSELPEGFGISCVLHVTGITRYIILQPFSSTTRRRHPSIYFYLTKWHHALVSCLKVH